MQFPQAVGSDAVFRSHPVPGTPSQFENPRSQAPIVQVPLVQFAVALAREHALPHWPQFAGSLPVAVSHPGAPGAQSVKPTSQAAMEHSPDRLHSATAFGATQGSQVVAAQPNAGSSVSTQPAGHTFAPGGQLASVGASAAPSRLAPPVPEAPPGAPAAPAAASTVAPPTAPAPAAPAAVGSPTEN